MFLSSYFIFFVLFVFFVVKYPVNPVKKMKSEKFLLLTSTMIFAKRTQSLKSARTRAICG